MEDTLAPKATEETKNKKVIIKDTGTFHYAYFEGTDPHYDCIAKFWGWNSARQIYFHLVDQGYEEIES